MRIGEHRNSFEIESNGSDESPRSSIRSNRSWASFDGDEYRFPAFIPKPPVQEPRKMCTTNLIKKATGIGGGLIFLGAVAVAVLAVTYFSTRVSTLDFAIIAGGSGVVGLGLIGISCAYKKGTEEFVRPPIERSSSKDSYVDFDQFLRGNGEFVPGTMF